MRNCIAIAQKTLQFRDRKVLSRGYGRIASSVMENEYITVGAKCLYSYLISITGISSSCYPSNAKMMKALGIKNKVTLNNYKFELVSQGLLHIEERKYKSGRITSNRYFPTQLMLFNEIGDDG